MTDETTVQVPLKKTLQQFQGSDALINIQEIGRTPVTDIHKSGNRFGLVFRTKKQVDDAGNEILRFGNKTSGGRPGVWLKLGEEMQNEYQMDEGKNSVAIFFHSSALPILEKTQDKLATNMDLVEILVKDSGNYGFLIAKRGSSIVGETLTFVEVED